MSSWKAAGITFAEYVTRTTTAVRAAVKPSLASKYAMREEVHYKKQVWQTGKAGEKLYYTGSISHPVKGYTSPHGHMEQQASPQQ